MLKLVIQDDEGKTTVVPLIRDEVTIGRKEGNTIRLTERNVSRKHARILQANGALAIEDLSSYNGIRVNGSRIANSCHLAVSDRVQIGDYLIELKTVADNTELATREVSESDRNPFEETNPSITPLMGIDGDVASVVPMKPIPKSLEMDVPLDKRTTQRMETNQSPLSALADPMDDATADNALTPPMNRGAELLGRDRLETLPEDLESDVPIARLVITSHQFAGTEFLVDKDTVIIGRTEENDVVLDHRSISRHHAEIVREGGAYILRDLDSSNGVQVNGDGYRKVELRTGDTVELGHVVMRFLAEEKDQAAVAASLRGQRMYAERAAKSSAMRPVWILCAMAVVATIVWAFVLRQEGRVSSTSVPSATTRITNETVTATASNKAEPVTSSVDKNKAKLQSLLERAQQAIKKEEFDAAESLIQEMSLLSNASDETDKLQLALKQARSAKMLYREFREAIEARRSRLAISKYTQIDTSSVYRKKIREDDTMRLSYRKFVMNKAKRLAEAGRCNKADDVEREVNRITTIWPTLRGTVTSIVEACVEQTVPEKIEPKVEQNIDELLTKARNAAKAGQYAASLRQCRKVLRQNSRNQEAITLCAIAACNLKNKNSARSYIRMLQGQRANMASQICLRNGVSIE